MGSRGRGVHGNSSVKPIDDDGKMSIKPTKGNRGRGRGRKRGSVKPSTPTPNIDDSNSEGINYDLEDPGK